MRSIGLISSIIVASVLAIMSCAMDPSEGQPRIEAQGQELGNATSDDPLAASSDTAAEAAATVSPGGAAIVPAVSCSHVVFCNAPGSDGAQCQQDGCSDGQAENECKTEVKTVCGSPITCPLRFFFSGGGSTLLSCQPVICAGNAIECGGHCCGTSATFCAGTRCCDGIHCGGGCPC
jgi:hypothetical protein